MGKFQVDNGLSGRPAGPDLFAPALAFAPRSPICRAIPQADFNAAPASRRRSGGGVLPAHMTRRGSTGKDDAMALPDFSMRQLLEAGAHFGHQSHRWNPKMAPYIFGSRNSHPHHRPRPDGAAAASGAEAVSDTVAKGGRVLFVGTKRQASEAIADGRQALRAVLRQLALARRHADQLEDHLGLDRAPAQARRTARRGRQGPHQEGAPDADARARQAREGARRHQGHGRHARPDVRDRHQQGSDRDQGGQPPEHPGRSRSSTPTAIPTASPIRSRATTTPAAPSSSTATSSPRGDRRHFAQPGRGRRRHRRSRSADRRSRCRRRSSRKPAPPSPKPRPTGSSFWPRRAARRTISPSSPASARRSSRSSTSMACSIIGRSPR